MGIFSMDVDAGKQDWHGEEIKVEGWAGKDFKKLNTGELKSLYPGQGNFMIFHGLGI